MTTTQRIVVAVNPAAGVGRRGFLGARTIDRLRAAGHAVTPILELRVSDLVDRVREQLASGADALVVVGGDGMVNLGASLVVGQGIPLGIVPSGTGNDLARGLGLPLDDLDAVLSGLVDALQRPTRAVDVARISGRPSGQALAGFAPTSDASGAAITLAVNAVSAGFDAVINDRANRMRWPKGEARYVVALLRELAKFRAPTYDLVVDGVAEVTRAMFVSVANSSSIGGGMKIVPDARIDDGLLDLFVVQPLSRLGLLRLFPRVFAGSHVGLPIVSIRRVRSVRIACHTPLIAYADGERIGALPITVEVEPGQLRLLDQTPS